MSLVPPATRDAWSYSGDFYVEVTGHNRHRRATIPEIKAIFDGTDGSKDRPGHWYEAQLIHYGLPPSKTKGTAKMRLLDAVNKGNMAVPARVLKVETELKKEWTKRDREAKQAVKKVSGATAAKGSGKRKANDAQLGLGPGTTINIFNFNHPPGSQATAQAEPTAPAAKKAKTTKTTKATKVTKATKTTKATPSSKAANAKKASTTTKPSATAKEPPSSGRKQTARRGGSHGSEPARPNTEAPARPEQTASRGRPYNPSSTGRSAAPAGPSSDRPPGTKQTARRSRPFNPASQGRPTAANNDRLPQFDATPSRWNLYDDPPPPYPGPVDIDHDDYGNGGYYYDDDEDRWDDPPSANESDFSSRGSSDDGDRGRPASPGYDDRDDEQPLPPLGLLNGRYNIHCTRLPDFVNDRGQDSGIIFTLDGNRLWGSFEIGPVSGILLLDERPWRSSHERLYFRWRGEDEQGGEHDADDDGSYVKFLGDGEIAGKIAFYNDLIEFNGYRVSGQETRSEVSAASMRRQWEQRQR